MTTQTKRNFKTSRKKWIREQITREPKEKQDIEEMKTDRTKRSKKKAVTLLIGISTERKAYECNSAERIFN